VGGRWPCRATMRRGGHRCARGRISLRVSARAASGG
jgi:hypothetical protein